MTFPVQRVGGEWTECHGHELCEAIEYQRKSLIQKCHDYESLLRNIKSFLDSIEWTDHTSEDNAANLMAQIDSAIDGDETY